MQRLVQTQGNIFKRMVGEIGEMNEGGGAKRVGLFKLVVHQDKMEKKLKRSRMHLKGEKEKRYSKMSSLNFRVELYH